MSQAFLVRGVLQECEGVRDTYAHAENGGALAI